MTETISPGISKITEKNGIEEYRMSNGMKILLVENHTAPVATFLVVYRVGSRNEAVGYTGATHLLEHMMFKGTPTFNSEKGTQIAATLHRIGASFNATTWLDRTNYFETIPSDKLELAIRLEADRMRNSLIRDSDRKAEFTVVRNELERGDNDPATVLDMQCFATAIREHPYHHPTIGWRSDVENMPTERLKEFYDTFYWPNNATVVVVGDFAVPAVLSLLDKYFGSIPPAPHPIPPVYTVEPPQQGIRRFELKRAGQLGIVMMNYRTPEATNPDTYPLVILRSVLSEGITSRLYQSLVERQLAVQIDAFHSQFRDPALFQISATLKPEVAHEKIEEVIIEELERLKNEPITESELNKAKNQLEARTIFSRDGTHNVAYQLSEAEAVADWHFYIEYLDNIKRVTYEDVQRVAKKYFNRDNLTVGYFIPIAPSSQPVEPAAQTRALHRPLNYSEIAGAANLEAWIAQGGLSKKTLFNSPEIALPTPDAQSSTASFKERTARRVFPNGMTVLVLENHMNPTVAIRGSLRAGSHFAPKDKPLLAEITAQMLNKGTDKRSKLEIAQELEQTGAAIEFNADVFATTIGARALSKDLKLILTTLAEMLRQPSFPQEELDKLKAQVIARIKRDQESTSVRAFERISQLVFERGSPFYRPPADELINSVESITVDDIRSFYRQQYGGGALILTIVGDVSTQQVMETVEQLFADWVGAGKMAIDVPRAEIKESRREVILLKDKSSVDIALGHAGRLRRGDPDYLAAMLANSALGQSTLSSRLGLRVRDIEGLTYGIYSRFFSPTLADGLWAVSVTVAPENVERAIDSTLAEIRRYVNEGITEEELRNEKSNFIGSFKVGLGTNSGIANQLLSAEFFDLGVDYLDRYPQMVEEVTIEQVNEAIRNYFKPDRMTIVIAGELNRVPTEPLE